MEREKRVHRLSSMRMTGGSFLLIVLLSIALLTSCSNLTAVTDGSKKPGQSTLKLSLEEYPKVDGSTATIPLSEAIGAAVMGMSIEEVRPYIVHNTTHDAYVNLIDGKADIIFVTSPSEEEFAYAEQKHVELEVVPIVSEGFVFLTNNDNPVKGLTLRQIRDIYSGKITNLKEVGGKDKEIIAYQRQPNSGSQTGMLDLVIGSDEIMEAPTEKVIAEMGALVDSVAVYTNEEEAIGYSYYYYVTDMWKNEKVKLLAVDGVYPNKDTISSGDYPIQTAYYAVMRSEEPKDSNARRLLAWILSEPGQQIAEEAGYVKLGN